MLPLGGRGTQKMKGLRETKDEIRYETVEIIVFLCRVIDGIPTGIYQT